MTAIKADVSITISIFYPLIFVGDCTTEAGFVKIIIDSVFSLGGMLLSVKLEV
jgi:hypothetical protein